MARCSSLWRRDGQQSWLDDTPKRRHLRNAPQNDDPGIAAKGVAGYRGIQLVHRALAGGVEFITVMWFDSWEAVRAFAGEDFEQAYVLPGARAVLKRFDARSVHYEVREQLSY